MDAMLRTRRQSLALLLAGCAVPAAARAAVPEPQGPQAPLLPEARFTPDHVTTELSGMEDRLRRMTAPVMIDGQGPFEFVVDTGTNRSVISDRLAAMLKLPAGRTVRLDGIGGVRAAPTVTLARFQVGERVADRLAMPVLAADALKCDGILGVDGLRNQRVVLDLAGQRLHIEPSSRPDDRAGSVVRARNRYGQLTMVDTDLDGVQVGVIVDTGAEATIGNSVLRQVMGRRRSADPAVVEKVSLQGATGETAYGDYGGVPDFRIGKLRVGNLRVIYADLHCFDVWGLSRKPAMVMGMDLIRLFDTVALDYGRNQVRFVLPKQPYLDPAGDPVRRF
jgi:predicted aspartyl protease